MWVRIRSSFVPQNESPQIKRCRSCDYLPFMRRLHWFIRFLLISKKVHNF